MIETVGTFGRLIGGQTAKADPTGTAFTAYNSLLKEYYKPGVHDILNNKRVLLRYTQRNMEDVSGRYVVIALRVGRNAGTQFIMTRAPIPDPDPQKYQRATYTTKYHYGRLLIDGPAISSSRNDRGAFLRLLDGEVSGLAQDMQVEANRVAFGDGSGALARVTSIAGNVITVQDPGGIVSPGSGTQYFEEGMRIAIFNGANEGTVAVGRAVAANFRADGGGNHVAKILAVNGSASTITLVDRNGVAFNYAGVTAGDYIYKASTYTNAILDAHTNRGHEMNGLAAIVDNTDPRLQRPDLAGGNQDESNGLGGLTPTDSTPTAAAIYEPKWTAYVVENGGIPVPFHESLFQQGIDGVDLLGDGAISMMLTTHGIRRVWAFQLAAEKQFVNTTELPGGFRALSYNEIPLLVDKDCQRGRVYGLDLDALQLCYEQDYDWLTEPDGGNVLHRLDDYHAFQATLWRAAELVTPARNRHFLLRDIQDN
jgi:hypothetical protein